MRKIILVASLAGLATACMSDPEQPVDLVKRSIPVARLKPLMETVPVASSDDAADDPAIWVAPAEPGLSRILGTDKQSGLAVYNLQGELLQFLASGRLNNVDLRQSVEVDGQLHDLAVATNRTHIGMDIFGIDPESGQVTQLGSWPLDLVEPYGLCLYRDAQNGLQVFVNSTDGHYQQWLMNSVDPLRMEMLREFHLASQPEGCAADDIQHQLFVGEEGRGVWRLTTDPAQTELVLIDEVGAGVLVADVEGMDIYRTAAGQAYLVVSSQGDFTYAVYDAQGDYGYRGSFQIAADPERGIDGAQETDGLAVSAANLGPGLEQGALVVQDGYNLQPAEKQNFKLVPWADIASALGLE